MKKHEHIWETSMFDCPSCGGILKLCSGRINSKKICDKYKCFNPEYCFERDSPRKKKDVFYRRITDVITEITSFERTSHE